MLITPISHNTPGHTQEDTGMTGLAMADRHLQTGKFILFSLRRQ